MKVSNITKIYHNKHNDVEALKGITLEVNNTGIIVLLGPSGCGKSTLLNILSGQDKEFEGTMEINERLDYITQDFRLFEAMSVEENLQIISSNQEQINYYLDLFEMNEHRTKKVKKCSNGQKKRVQFIRAMLQTPSLLLCDEPTAALDHENSELLMEQLKKISKDVKVFLVTHDIALAEKYADRILTMDNGEIVSDKRIHQLAKETVEYKNCEQSTKQTIKTILKKFKSRPFETILTLVLALFICSSLYVSVNLFQSVNNQTYNQHVWKQNLNLIVSRTKEENLINSDAGPVETNTFYKKEAISYDVYDDTEILNAVNEIKDIIAIETFYDVKRHFSSGWNKTNEWQNKSFQKDTSFTWTGWYEYNKQPSYFPMLIDRNTLNKLADEFIERILNTPEREQALRHIYTIDENGIVKENRKTIFEMNEYEIEGEKKNCIWSSYSFDNIKMKGIDFHPYELVNAYELPLRYGKMPTALNEVVLELKTAEFIKYKYGYNSLEDMIDKEIEVSIPLNGLQASLEYNKDLLEFATLKIAGITSYKSENQRQIFFLPGGVKATLLKNIVKEGANVTYTEFNVLVNPQADVAKVKEQLNTMIEPINNEFKLYIETTNDYVKEQDIKEYMNPTTYAFYAFCLVMAIFLMLVIYYALNRKRIKKENLILHIYGYNTFKEKAIRLVFLYTIVLLIVICILPSIVDKGNVIAMQYLYENLLTYNVLFILLCVVITYIFHLAIEVIFSKNLK